MTYDAIDVAKYVEYYSVKKTGYGVSKLKLLSLLYFIQAYALIEKDEPMFFNDIEAWECGPIVPEVFRCSKFLWSGIVHENYYKDVDSITYGDKELIDAVFDEFQNYSITEMVELSMNQAPWRNTLKNKAISLDSIKEYFTDDTPVDVFLTGNGEFVIKTVNSKGGR